METIEQRSEAMYRMNCAQVAVLVKAGLVGRPLAARIVGTLRAMRSEGMRHGDYLALEKDLIARVGTAASNLHLGRSRNDMGATSERMLIRDELLETLESLGALQAAVLDCSDRNQDAVIPAYTHGRAAQPTTVGHYLLAFFDALQRDAARLRSAYAVINLCPLGSGALSTSGFALDRDLLATSLGFDGLVENSYDAVGVSPGDTKAEAAAAAMICALTISRFAQDLILFTMDEIGFLKLGSRKTGGSSIMPQKRNPGFLEKVRADSAAVLGQACSVFADCHNNHLQDTRDVRIAAMDHAVEALRILRGSCDALADGLGAIEADGQRGSELCLKTFATATELADTLVRECGLDFRAGHAVSSAAATWMTENNRSAADLTSEKLAEISAAAIGQGVTLPGPVLARAVDPKGFVEIRTSTGGPAPAEVARMAAARRVALAEGAAWRRQRRGAIEQAYRSLDDAVSY